MQIMDALLRAQEAAAPEVGRGRLAEYIPSLAAVDPRQFGMVDRLLRRPGARHR